MIIKTPDLKIFNTSDTWAFRVASHYAVTPMMFLTRRALLRVWKRMENDFDMKNMQFQHRSCHVMDPFDMSDKPLYMPGLWQLVVFWAVLRGLVPHINKRDAYKAWQQDMHLSDAWGAGLVKALNGLQDRGERNNRLQSMFFFLCSAHSNAADRVRVDNDAELLTTCLKQSNILFFHSMTFPGPRQPVGITAGERLLFSFHRFISSFNFNEPDVPWDRDFYDFIGIDALFNKAMALTMHELLRFAGPGGGLNRLFHMENKRDHDRRSKWYDQMLATRSVTFMHGFQGGDRRFVDQFARIALYPRNRSLLDRNLIEKTYLKALEILKTFLTTDRFAIVHDSINNFYFPERQSPTRRPALSWRPPKSTKPVSISPTGLFFHKFSLWVTDENWIGPFYRRTLARFVCVDGCYRGGMARDTTSGIMALFSSVNMFDCFQLSGTVSFRRALHASSGIFNLRAFHNAFELGGETPQFSYLRKTYIDALIVTKGGVLAEPVKIKLEQYSGSDSVMQERVRIDFNRIWRPYAMVLLTLLNERGHKLDFLEVIYLIHAMTRGDFPVAVAMVCAFYSLYCDFDTGQWFLPASGYESIADISLTRMSMPHRRNEICWFGADGEQPVALNDYRMKPVCILAWASGQKWRDDDMQDLAMLFHDKPFPHEDDEEAVYDAYTECEVPEDSIYWKSWSLLFASWMGQALKQNKFHVAGIYRFAKHLLKNKPNTPLSLIHI